MPQCYSVIINRGIRLPGQGKEVVDGINPVDQGYIYQLMSTVKSTGSNIFGSHIQMHTGNHNNGLSLAKELQQHLTKEHRKDGAIDQSKYKKRLMELKWTERHYHVQDNAAIVHQYVKMYCNTNQFPEFTFCGSYAEPRGARGFSKHYHRCFDTKLGRLVPSQDVLFFYSRSHLSALQNCVFIFSANFVFIFTFKQFTTQFSH